jgi:hypothetical protein
VCMCMLLCTHVCVRARVCVCPCAAISGIHGAIFQIEAKVNSMIISALVAVRKEFEAYNWGEQFSNDTPENVELDQIRLAAHDSVVRSTKCDTDLSQTACAGDCS